MSTKLADQFSRLFPKQDNAPAGVGWQVHEDGDDLVVAWHTDLDVDGDAMADITIVAGDVDRAIEILSPMVPPEFAEMGSAWRDMLSKFRAAGVRFHFEHRAAWELRAADRLFDSGERSNACHAQRWYQKVMERYPGTVAASETAKRPIRKVTDE